MSLPPDRVVFNSDEMAPSVLFSPGNNASAEFSGPYEDSSTHTTSPSSGLSAPSSTAPSNSKTPPALLSYNVDYFSHPWNEFDLKTSWSVMTKHKKTHVDGIRLENASWRKWMQKKLNLKQISPQQLRWKKEEDITWLYGPFCPSVGSGYAVRAATQENGGVVISAAAKSSIEDAEERLGNGGLKNDSNKYASPSTPSGERKRWPVRTQPRRVRRVSAYYPNYHSLHETSSESDHDSVQRELSAITPLHASVDDSPQSVSRLTHSPQLFPTQGKHQEVIEDDEDDEELRLPPSAVVLCSTAGSHAFPVSKRPVLKSQYHVWVNDLKKFSLETERRMQRLFRPALSETTSFSETKARIHFSRLSSTPSTSPMKSESDLFAVMSLPVNTFMDSQEKNLLDRMDVGPLGQATTDSMADTESTRERRNRLRFSNEVEVVEFPSVLSAKRQSCMRKISVSHSSSASSPSAAVSDVQTAAGAVTSPSEVVGSFKAKANAEVTPQSLDTSMHTDKDTTTGLTEYLAVDKRNEPPGWLGTIVSQVAGIAAWAFSSSNQK